MPSQPIALRGPRVVLRSLSPVDIPELRRIRAEPEVARWWGQPDDESFDAFEHGERLTIEVDGRVAGQVQFEEEPDPEHRYAGIDIYLDPPLHGQGLGAESLVLVARYLFEVKDHHRLTIDPAAANSRAIRSYERVGFRPVGIMRRAERGPDGTWHDGLLMDLLRGELVDPDEA